MRLLSDDDASSEVGRDLLALLGTAAGRTWYGGSTRTGIASALRVGGRIFMVDCGSGAPRRLLQSRLCNSSAAFSGLEQLSAVFITHMHSDHVIGLPELLVFGIGEGLGGSGTPVRLVGPGPRGKLQPVTAGADKEPLIVSPGNPTPGLQGLVEGILSAFALDLNDNVRDSLRPNPLDVITASEILVPPRLNATADTPVPDTLPFVVYEDDEVSVTATLVDHGPVFPAFAFRFETEQSSVVFSGDTCASANLVRLAQGADVLVHEVIDPRWIERRFATASDARSKAKAHHLMNSHTSVDVVGEVAERARAKNLVLTHLAPGTNSDSDWLDRVKGYSGQVWVGHDLDVFELPGTVIL